MKPRLQVSKAALGLIKQFEGYRRSSARLADGRWTIGYGHTLTAREGVEVNQSDAEALLLYDLLAIGGAVNDLTFTPLTQNQFDALCAFAFNIGRPAFEHSNVLKLINAGDLLQAAQAIEAWRKADFEGDQIVVDGLIRRRAAEKALFLTPPGGFVPTPSAVVQPRLDADAAFANPVQLDVALVGAQAVAQRVAPVAPAPVEPAALPVEIAPPPATLPQPEPAPDVPPERLCEIPGYGAQATPEHRPESRWANLTLPQLVLVGVGGLGLLAAAGLLSARGANAAGVAQTGDYALAAIIGVAGAAGAFWSIYQVLNRLDSED